MYIPYAGEVIQYHIYSKSLYIDVLFDNDCFYMHVNSLCILFDKTQDAVEDAIRKYYKKKDKKISVVDDDILGDNVYQGLAIIEAVGGEFDQEEAYRFLNWAEDRLEKYKEQSSSGCTQYIHNTDLDYFITIESYLDVLDVECVSLELMIRYLKLIELFYTKFLNKLLEIENADHIAVSDVEQLDAIELYYVERRLADSLFSKMGEDIQQNVYLATLQDVVVQIKTYLGWKEDVYPSEKMKQLRVKALRWNVEPGQLLYLIDRFEYFSNQLIRDYNQVTSFEYDERPSRFSFSKLNHEALKIRDLIQRRSFFVEAKIKANRELIEMSGGDSKKDDCKQYIDKCLQSIELTDYEISQQHHILPIQVKADIHELKPINSSIHPSTKKKTDIIKILSAMYDAKMFADADGNPLTNKQKMMEAFGEFLGDDFTAYSASLSQAKSRDEKTFLKPFKEIEKEALRYFNEVGNTDKL